MRTRKDIEEFEERNLAAYAMKSKDSAGRDFKEPKHDMRTCYQRDRDRIVHCEAFRKLEYKTQVFAIFEGDYYRTRLTHTIEVAQIGRTIGRSLGLNEDLIEAIALAHDLGHPPFGHTGEVILNEIMKEHGGFNHNKRSFDIVTKYEKRYPNFVGLNLTREVLTGILKHHTKYDQASYSEDYQEGPALEARVVDFADSLAYLNHDIDDGLTSGYITEKDLMGSSLWQRVYGKAEKFIRSDDLEMKKYHVVKQLIDVQVRDFLAATDSRLKELNLQSIEEVKNYKGIIAGFSPEIEEERDNLHNLLMIKLYNHYHVVRTNAKSKRIITDLFEAYFKQPEQLPYSIYQRDREYSEDQIYAVICNYIASMTDRFALDEHKKLFNPYTKV